MSSKVIRRSRLNQDQEQERLKSEPRGSKGKRLNQDQEQEQLKLEPRGSKGKRLNQDQEQEQLKSEPQLKTHYLSKKYEDDDKPFMFNLDGLVYMNKAWQRTTNPNVYAYPPCPVGVGGLVPLYIDDDNLPTLICHCQLALNFYNKTNQGPTFVFHQLVNCSYYPPNALAPGLTHHITFQAQTVGSPSNITTFMAKVTEAFQDEPPRVFDRVIKF